MKDLRIIAILDQCLGAEAMTIINKHLTNVVVVEDPTGKGRERYRVERNGIRQTILSENWPAMISFYQEMVVQPCELQVTGRPWNIHPSRPEIPGMSYDIGPLDPESESFGMQGGTFHVMTEGIDQGPLIRILEAPVPAGAAYPDVRRRNQEFCLELLDWTCSAISRAKSLESLDRAISFSSRRVANRSWGTYITKDDVERRLLTLHTKSPNHEALRGNWKFEKVLKKRAPLHHVS